MGAYATRGLNSGGLAVLWSRERQSEPRLFWKGGASLYYGGGGLLIVLGIIALVLGWTLVGIILIVLGLLGGGFGFFSGRRAR